MEAAENVIFKRTDGNTGPIIVQLQRKTDAGTTVNVADGATVRLDVRQPGGDLAISGTARGDGSGTFLFVPTALDVGAWNYRFDINVLEGGDDDVYARGRIITAAKIGA